MEELKLRIPTFAATNKCEDFNILTKFIEQDFADQSSMAFFSSWL